MIQIGSSSEYGKLSRAGTELDRINPSTMYEATKGAATLLCQGYARHYDLDICIARPYSVYGPHERPHRLFPRLWRAFYENEPMTLYHGVHDFIYIDDFVRGIDILIRHPNKPAGDIINFGSGSEYQNIEVLNYFKKITGKNAPVQYIDMMAKTFESDMWVCDPTYASEQYGFDTKFSLGTGIEEYIRRMKEL